MEIATIGFTRSSAEHFFERLGSAGARSLIDTRLHRNSQLAGFARAPDLPYLLKRLCGMKYLPEPLLAPTDELLSAYRAKEIDWAAYERSYIDLLVEREIAATLDRAQLDGAVLLCSEATPEQCHRRLAAEFLAKHWPNVTIRHL